MTSRVCTMREPGQDGPCERVMIRRAARPERARLLPLTTGSAPAAAELFACPVHDGDAASSYTTNPHFNRPRKD